MGGFVITAFFWNNVIQEHSQEMAISSRGNFFHEEPKKETRTSLFFRRPRREKNKTSRLQQSLRLKKVAREKNEEPVTIVFAPHPDDEILCCSQKIEEKVKQGERVKVIFFTDGDAHDPENSSVSRAYGTLRKQESTRALSRLGVRSEDLFFLGFPDGALQNLKEESVVRSDFTHRKKSSQSSSFPLTEYSYENLENNLVRILNKYQVDEVYIPSATKDEHPDHKFVGEMVSRLLETQHVFPKTYEYTVHGEGVDKMDLLSVDEKKLSLIRIFKSQFHTKMHESFMEKWARIKEVFDRKDGSRVVVE